MLIINAFADAIFASLQGRFLLEQSFLISRNLTLPNCTNWGVELGLNIIKLKRISSIELPLELCERWLREDDAVYQTSGAPTWISLVRALRSIGANSLADMIEQERK